MNGEEVFSYFLQEAGFDKKQMRRLTRLRKAVVRGQGIKEVREENWRNFGAYLIAQGKIRRETLLRQEGLETDEQGNIKPILRKEQDVFPERKRRLF